MSKAPNKRPYAVTMYADDERKIAFYQFSIGQLTSDQHAIFIRDGKFSNEGTKECTCCNGAIYVVHVRRRWDYKKFPITANPSKSVPNMDNPTTADLDRDTEFNKAQTAWAILRKEPLYMKATKKAYQRRKKIYLDAIWLRRLAHTIRNNHPTPVNTSAKGGTSPGIPPVELSLNSLRPKIDYEKLIAGIYEKNPETRPYNSKRLLLYLKDWAREQGVEIKITDSRIRHLQVWKDNAVHRESGETRFGYNSGDIAEENDQALESAKLASLEG